MIMIMIVIILIHAMIVMRMINQTIRKSTEGREK